MHCTICQDTIIFTPDQLLIGTGWHQVEKDGDSYFRWTGPDLEATIQLWIRRDRPNRLNLTIRQAATEDLLSALALEADGIPLQATLGQGRNPAYVTAVLPTDSAKPVDQPTLLTLRVPKTLPAAQLHPDPKDNRKLGLALSRLDAFPLGRPLFTARKYADPVPFDGICLIRHNPAVRDAVIQGLTPSAYDYFVKKGRPDEQATFELDAAFDERPGDLYDILQEELRHERNRLEKQYREEINLLRGIVHRQGDLIREMVKKK